MNTTENRADEVIEDFDAEQIPQELKDLKQWVCWRYEDRTNEKTGRTNTTKPLICVHTGRHASHSKPNDWTDYERALTAYSQAGGALEGIGFVFSAGDDYCGIDIDDCIDENGKTALWAERIITELNSYTEVSPSGRGVKIWVKGRLPGAGVHKTYEVGAVGMFDRDRYFTMTGRRVAWHPSVICDRQPELYELYAKLDQIKVERPEAEDSATVSPTDNQLSDEDIIRMAEQAKNGSKFLRLMGGDPSDYDNDESRADLALITILLWWTRHDVGQVDRIFRQSKLCDEKWEERQDYRDRTFKAALKTLGSKRYEPGQDDDVGWEPQYQEDSGAQTQDTQPEPEKKKRGVRNPLIILAASELGPDEPVPWIWPGKIARGHTTLISSLWKAGKSTLISRLLVSLSGGYGIHDSIPVGNVLVVSEESKSKWAERRSELNLGDNCKFLCKHYKSMPSKTEWQLFNRDIAQKCIEMKLDLVIYDTISKLLPVDNENDAAQVSGAMIATDVITDTGAALLLVHHPRKGDATEGQSFRGSGVYASHPDILIEMRRYDPENKKDRRRVLTGFGRWEECECEQVWELQPTGYVMVGQKAEAKQCDRMAVIKDLMPEDSTVTAADIRAMWPVGNLATPGIKTLRADLAEGLKVNPPMWYMSGSGKKGDPCRYSLNSIPVYKSGTAGIA